MYLMPIAGVKIFWPGLIILGIGVGVIGGFFGMGGAWMVTPGLNILGFPMAFAIGTDIAHMAGKSLMDSQALSAALLHDVMEDTNVTKAELAEKFGKMVAELVDGVSKLDRIEFQSHEQAQAENFRKMVLAMTRDVRVILIKLADRLHNMRTLDAMNPKKRVRIARETLDIYAPIANRLGLNRLFQELQELSFKHLYPNRYRVLHKALFAARGNRREVVDKILEAIRGKLSGATIEATVTGREKNLYSIYHKMQDKHLTFSQVYDIYGFRIIVRDVPSCYLALGALHGLYKPIPGKFKDYIAIPKANGYQSLHTTLFGPFGTPLEVQIRTFEMHKIAEAGVASHWLYKQSDAELNELQKKTHQWLQSLLEMQTQSGSSIEFLEHLKVDLFPDEVYVFTPKGRILSLPHGATCVDFAYAVHTDIGNRCVAAKVNHELVPLRSELRNGDRVEIITAAHAKPNPAWLNYVVTGKARSHIRHFLKTMQYEESAQLGERLLNQALAALSPKAQKIDDASWDKLLKDQGDQDAPGDPRRHRAGQAARHRGRATAADDRRAGRRVEPPAGHRDHPRLRGHGAAVREVLPPDSGRPDHRLRQEGPGPRGAHPRLRRGAQDARRPGQVARRGMGTGHAQAVRREHPPRGLERTRRAREAGGRDRGVRGQHRQRQPRAGRLQRVLEHPFHAAGPQPPAPRADHARPAAHSRGDPHHPPEGLTPSILPGSAPARPPRFPHSPWKSSRISSCPRWWRSSSSISCSRATMRS